ncbi:MAG: hypothetical protein NTW86_15745, partial [Candidatus Sumerlaeota bacterium]|nr:hypothetical protein [Candidatus Sumerlaeota bacterium]
MTNRRNVLAALGLALLCSFAAAQDLASLLQSAQGAPSTQPAQFDAAPSGALRFLSAPSGQWFPVPSQKTDPDSLARAFFAQQGPLFGLQSKAVGFATEKIKQEPRRSIVRLQQTYGGLPVFAAETIVQTLPWGGIESVIADLMTDTALLDAGGVSLFPTLSAAEEVCGND